LGYSAGRKTTIDVTGPDLEARADGWLFPVRPITDRDRRRVATSPADLQHPFQADRRAGLIPSAGGRSPAPSDREDRPFGKVVLAGVTRYENRDPEPSSGFIARCFCGFLYCRADPSA